MILDYLKGIGGLIAAAVLGILALLFFFVFNVVFAAVLMVILIILVLALPYYFGRENQKEKPGNYKLKKIKE